jgi:uncharacterized secreted repeat protein (TIGR03808 family)
MTSPLIVPKMLTSPFLPMINRRPDPPNCPILARKLLAWRLLSIGMASSLLPRRTFLAGLAGAALAAGQARANGKLILADADFRGGLDASHFGVRPGVSDHAAKAFNAMLRQAAAQNLPVFLPPGTYELSNIQLPENLRLEGVAGATRLSYSGDGSFLDCIGGNNVTLANLVIDGNNRWLADASGGLMTFHNTSRLVIDNCEIMGAGKCAIWAEGSGGRFFGNRISGAADAAIYAVESTGLEIADNSIADCGNGGILVHRWKKAADGTMISGNRISGIRANAGGTGQNGNGINLFRADNVIVSDNHISDCAFTAIRGNAASDLQIIGNSCARSGETAIYAEFGFEGAMIANNLIDGAANGISSVNFNEGGRLALISANIVRNLSLTAPYVEDGNYFGIGISAEADCVISGNLIENAPLWGIQLGWGPYLRNVSVTGNVVRNAGTGCAVSVVEGAGIALIHDNLFSGIEGTAIAGFRWAERATDELVSSPPSAYPHLDIAANRLG